LPQKFLTPVGERGIRLSGGQRQRIGLARALYKGADVLVMDEATSALDDDTEKSVIEEVNSLGDELTVLMIAHRVSTLSKCNVIYRLEQGVAHKMGDYQDLLKYNASKAVS
jgi:ABC-type bacteriocin/lantibiotic exporter with double-glycine peptidase domain